MMRFGSWIAHRPIGVLFLYRLRSDVDELANEDGFFADDRSVVAPYEFAEKSLGIG
jgi:hypothetical protein